MLSPQLFVATLFSQRKDSPLMQPASNAPPEDRPSLPEKILRPYMEWMHGKKMAEHQWDFMRCVGCRRLVNWKRIKSGGCDCDTGNKLKPAKITFWEKVKILIFPWSI